MQLWATTVTKKMKRPLDGEFKVGNGEKVELFAMSKDGRETPARSKVESENNIMMSYPIYPFGYNEVKEFQKTSECNIPPNLFSPERSDGSDLTIFWINYHQILTTIFFWENRWVFLREIEFFEIAKDGKVAQNAYQMISFLINLFSTLIMMFLWRKIRFF